MIKYHLSFDCTLPIQVQGRCSVQFTHAQILSLLCVFGTKVVSAQNTLWGIPFSEQHSQSIQGKILIDIGQRGDMGVGQWCRLLPMKKAEAEEERSVAHGGCSGVHWREVLQNGGRGYFYPCWAIHCFSPNFSSFFGSKSKAGEFCFFIC